MNSRKALLFLACILLTQAVGGLGGLATVEGVREWYPLLRKPFFNPPAWVFGPVWTALYFLMGCSLYLVLGTPRGRERSRALWAFGIQLALNGTWSFLFFYFRSPGLALLEISLLWLAIGWMILAFRSVIPMAAWLQLPYLAWVSFATALNGALWWLNR